MERVDVAYVLLHDPAADRVLMVQNEVHWSFPGGKREDGETLAEAAVREAKEESGFDVEVGEVINISERFRGDHILFVTFRGQITGGQIAVGQDAEVQRVEWKSISEAQWLMPHYGDIRALLTPGARYRVER